MSVPEPQSSDVVSSGHPTEGRAAHARRVAVTMPALVRLALFYGVAGFGGGYSVLAQLRRDLVEKRKWIDGEEFLVIAELSKSLPGTPATTLIALLGQRIRGPVGGALAAGAFLLPSMIVMMICAAAYSLLRKASALGAFFDGMGAAMVGVVAATTFDLARSALRSRLDVIAAILCAALLATRILSEPILAVIAVGVGIARATAKARPRRAPRNEEPPTGEGPSTGEEPPRSERLHAAAPWFLVLFGGGAGVLAGLVRVFVPIGVLTFGGGLAMIPGIEHTVVTEQRWLDPKTFADAIALGQITPGPVAICATFIGYRVGGIAGALVATGAMFAPAVSLALVVGHSIERFRGNAVVEAALRALAPAVIGMLAAATISLGRASIEQWLGAAIAAAALALMWRGKISPIWALLGGGLAYLVAGMLH